MKKAKKSLMKKLKGAGGFTMGETLATVLILLMVAGVVATGIPAALNVYRNAVDAANAQVLLSTTINALRDELSTAWDVKKSNDTTITYMSSDTGSRSKLYLSDGVVMLQEYDDYDDTWHDSTNADDGGGGTSGLSKPEARSLVSGAMTRSTKNANINMKVAYTVSVSGDSIQFNDLTISRDGQMIAKMPGNGLVIRALGGVDE